MDSSEEYPHPPRPGKGRLHFPDSTHDAWFDYATAIVGLNYPAEAGASSPQVERDLERWTKTIARLHEEVHVLQSACFPHFMRWCVSWRDIAVDVKSKIVADGGGWDAIAVLPDGLPGKTLRAISELLAELSTVGPDGLSLLNLLEAHAALSEIYVLSDGNATAAEARQYFELHLSDPSYRLALEVVAFALGDEAALEHFPSLVAAALCYNRPTEAFHWMLRWVATRRILERRDASIDELCSAANTTDLRKSFYGLPSAQSLEFSKLDSLPHALESRRILQACAENGVSLDQVLEDRRRLRIGVLAVDPMTLFAVDDSGAAGVSISHPIDGEMPDRAADDYVDSPEFSSYRKERYLMAISQRLLREDGISDSSDSSPALSWILYVSEVPVDIFIAISGHPKTPEMVAEEYLAELAIDQLRSPVSQSGHAVNLLGRGELKFIVDTPLEVWQHPVTRAYVRALSDLCPEYPLFLAPVMFTAWFGSLADPVAVSSVGVDLSHRSTIFEMQRFKDAAAERMAVSGLNLTSLVTGFLAPARSLGVDI